MLQIAMSCQHKLYKNISIQSGLQPISDMCSDWKKVTVKRKIEKTWLKWCSHYLISSDWKPLEFV